MYSQCPDCQARFRVTAAVLRAAHGTVRCGRCGSAFDALERLSDAIPPAQPDASSVALEPALEPESLPRVESVPAEFHFTTEDLEKVFIDARDWQTQMSATAPPPDATETAEAELDSPLVVVEEPAGIEDITLEGERISLDEPLSQELPPSIRIDSADEALDREAAAPSQKPEAPAAEFEAVVPPPPPPQSWRSPPIEEAAQSPPPGQSLPEAPAMERGAGWRRLAWASGSALLVIVLAAQLVYHYRQELARNAQVGPALRSFFERIDRPLDPSWNLGAFELLQWGRSQQPDTPGQMQVRATLRNRADFAQPHPLLRLEIEDRFGAPVAVREFEPRDYLVDPAQAQRLLEAGAAAEAQLLIADPGRDAIGYRLDVCVRETPSRLRCAQGSG